MATHHRIALTILLASCLLGALRVGLGAGLPGHAKAPTVAVRKVPCALLTSDMKARTRIL